MAARDAAHPAGAARDAGRGPRHGRASMPRSRGRCWCGCTPYDDAVQVRAGMAMGALMRGDIAECERVLEEVRLMGQGPWFGGHTVRVGHPGRARAGQGRRARPAWRPTSTAMREMGAIRFPGMDTSGMEPWTILAACGGAGGARPLRRDPGPARRTATGSPRTCSTRVVACSRCSDSFLDFPVTGMMLAALGGVAARPAATIRRPASACW